jgi:hypothetical protein
LGKQWEIVHGDDSLKDQRLVKRTSIRAYLTIAVLAAAWSSLADDGGSPRPKTYRGLLGPASKKVKVEQGKTWLWAGGAPSGPDAQWYDFTDSLLPAAELQFGIGKDRIRSIDDPLFVSPDDPRLATLAPKANRDGQEPRDNDQIEVIGFVAGEQARAYPMALLDRHELVNDSVDGKPIAVGW